MFSKNSNISNILGKGYKQVNNSDKTISWVYNTPVPGKLDVYGSINDEKIGFNLKNYDLSSTNPHLQSIHLVTGSNILYLMQHEIPFLNHYLNQTVYSTNNKGQYVGPQTSGIQLANHYMKRMLLLMSLSGGGMRTDITSGEKANVFIINNNSKNGGIKLYSTIDLYETIVRYKDLSDQVYVSLDGKQRWDNKWSKSGSQARIDNLLKQVKQKKIDVQIGFATMRKVMNF